MDIDISVARGSLRSRFFVEINAPSNVDYRIVEAQIFNVQSSHFFKSHTRRILQGEQSFELTSRCVDYLDHLLWGGITLLLLNEGRQRYRPRTDMFLAQNLTEEEGNCGDKPPKAYTPQMSNETLRARKPTAQQHAHVSSGA